jgi:zinc transporter
VAFARAINRVGRPMVVPASSIPEYGSDADGLVWGYLFAPGQRPRPIVCADAVSALAASRPGEFLWLHFNLANAAAAGWMKRHLDLPESFHEGMNADIASTRLEQEDGVLLAFLHDVVFDFRFDATDVASVSVAVNERVMLSGRAKPLRTVDRLRASVKGTGVFTSTTELFAQLLSEQADVLAEIIRGATRMVDQAEDSLLAGAAATKRSKLSSLRRMLVRFQRLLVPEPAALFRLLSRPPVWISEPDTQALRQAAEEFSRAVADCLALAERIRLIQEELATLANEKTNANLFVLTFVTVLAIPFNVVGALFGMNVAGIPFANTPHAFWLVVLVISAATGAAAWLGLRRR